MRRDDLIGLWSIDLLYGDGAQEDTWLAFRSNGTGWLAFLHYGLCELDTFDWSMSEGGPLTIVGNRYRSPPDPEQASSFSFADLCFRVTQRDTPRYGIVSVLTFDCEIWCSVSEFGLVSRDEDKLNPPVFDADPDT